MSSFRRFLSNIRVHHLSNSFIFSALIRPNPIITSNATYTTNNLIIDESDEDIDLNHNTSNSVSLDFDTNVFDIACNVKTPIKKSISAKTRNKIIASNTKRRGQGKNSYGYDFKLRVVKYKIEHGLSNKDVAYSDEFIKYKIGESTISEWYRKRKDIENKVKEGLGAVKKCHPGREIKYKHLEGPLKIEYDRRKKLKLDCSRGWFMERAT